MHQVLDRKLLRSQFETLVAPLVQHTVEPCRKALTDAGIKASINEVILVGSMTRMPRVLETVKSIFGRKPSEGESEDDSLLALYKYARIVRKLRFDTKFPRSRSRTW
jgi:molecular chaperone DnaK